MIKGRVELRLDKLKYLRGSANNVAIRKAINKAGVPVKAAVIAAAPQQFGNLKKSIRIRSKFYKKSSTWALIVGPSSSFSRVRKKPKVQKPKKKKPNKTLQALKKKAASLKKSALKKASKTVRNLAGRRNTLKSKLGRKLPNTLKNATKKPPKQPAVKPKKKLKRKRAWKGGKVRPARYAHLMEWGSAKLSGKRFLQKAMSSSRGRFASILQAALKTEIASLLTK